MQLALTPEGGAEGLGIGLGNICRRIWQGYPGGRMELESGSTGTTVRIVLPEKSPGKNRGKEER